MKKSHVPRTVGFSEGIDDEAVGLAFNKMQKLPQFAFIRRMLINRILTPHMCKFPESPALVLDLGCGTGHLLKQLRRLSNRRNLDMHLHGIDISKEIIAVARQNVNPMNSVNSMNPVNSDEVSLLKVTLDSYDGHTIPYPDNYFDIVASSLSLHHWEKPIQVLNEIRRVIKPAGYMVIFDLRRDAAPFWHRFLRMVSRRIVPNALKKVNEPLGSLLAAYTLDELSDIISDSEWKTASQCLDRQGPFLLLEAIK